VQRAQNELLRGGQNVPTDILLLEAVALFRTGKPDDACRQAGKPTMAATRYFRAGRSAVQQGSHQDAKKWLNLAVEFAVQASDESLKQEAGVYLKSIQTP
jgi:hypothetical protein